MMKKTAPIIQSRQPKQLDFIFMFTTVISIILAVLMTLAPFDPAHHKLAIVPVFVVSALAAVFFYAYAQVSVDNKNAFLLLYGLSGVSMIIATYQAVVHTTVVEYQLSILAIGSLFIVVSVVYWVVRAFSGKRSDTVPVDVE